MKTLKELAKEAYIRTLHSLEGRLLAANFDVAELDLQDAIRVEEIAHLDARGRVYGEDPEADGGDVVGFPGCPRYIANSFGEIDGAKFLNYCPETQTVTIRVDHSEMRDVWLELDFTLDRLGAWLGTQTAVRTPKMKRRKAKKKGNSPPEENSALICTEEMEKEPPRKNKKS